MKRRFVAASIVALAVFLSQGGGLVLAAICPHLRATQPDNACHTKTAATGAAHHHESAEAKSEASEVGEPDVRCNHCLVHSRNKREESSLQQTNTTQRTGDPKVATSFTPAGPAVVEIVAPVAKAHGPPGETAPLYLLVNVFRI
jgi:hypothetical protein